MIAADHTAAIYPVRAATASAERVVIGALRSEMGVINNRSWTMPGGEWRNRLTKTMGIRMDRENFEFLNQLTKEQRSDFSKVVRDRVTRSRLLLAVERFKKREASLGSAAELAGVPIGQMMTIVSGNGVENRIEEEDYLGGLEGLQQDVVARVRDPNRKC